MNERERIILGMSDEELLIWWNQSGYCPHHKLESRLKGLLYHYARKESARPMTAGDKRFPVEELPESATVRAPLKLVTQPLYAIETLLGRRLDGKRLRRKVSA